MLTLDTSAILAMLNRDDRHHAEARSAIQDDPGPFIVPSGIMGEAAYMIEARLGIGVLDAFLADLDDGAFTLDCGERDVPRVRTLITRYHDLPLGYADAACIACAERYRGRVLTYDLRHYSVVAREGSIQIVGFETA